MTQDFKTKLQELVDNAAAKYAQVDWADGIKATNAAHFSDFKQGAEFLMPMIERLIEQRNNAVGDQEHISRQQKLYECDSMDNELLNLLKEKK